MPGKGKLTPEEKFLLYELIAKPIYLTTGGGISWKVVEKEFNSKCDGVKIFYRGRKNLINVIKKGKQTIANIKK